MVWSRSLVAFWLVVSVIAGCERRAASVEILPLPPTPPAEVPESSEPRPAKIDDVALERLLASVPSFARYLADPARFRLEVLVTAVDRRGGSVALDEAGYRVDEELIYPASAIKTFLSLTALAAVEEAGGGPDTPVGLCDGGSCQPLRDPTNRETGQMTVGHLVRKLQLVSDNDAFTQLEGAVGPDAIHELGWSLGFSSLRVHHRMGEVPGAPRRARFAFLVPGAPITAPATPAIAVPATPVSRLEVGRAHVDELGRQQERPMSFATKNYVALRDLQRLNQRLVLPEVRPDLPPLPLSDRSRALLLEAMTIAPRASDNPRYRAPQHEVEAHKPMLPGLRRVVPKDAIRYVNKSGRAYGFHLENAYVEDRRSGLGFFVTAALYVNPNGVVNDDWYGYDNSTMPFMADLGELLARALLTP
ncbi:MAG: serine hydrolase [Myxococcales bacterium]|nr:serine hydrolase [Myxococcales bacterium]